jgi:hypothetical protein
MKDISYFNSAEDQKYHPTLVNECPFLFFLFFTAIYAGAGVDQYNSRFRSPKVLAHQSLETLHLMVDICGHGL